MKRLTDEMSVSEILVHEEVKVLRESGEKIKRLKREWLDSKKRQVGRLKTAREGITDGRNTKK